MYEWEESRSTVFVKAISAWSIFVLLGSQTLLHLSRVLTITRVPIPSCREKSLLLAIACRFCLCIICRWFCWLLRYVYSLWQCLLYVYHFLASPSEAWLPLHYLYRISVTLATWKGLMAIVVAVTKSWWTFVLKIVDKLFPMYDEFEDRWCLRCAMKSRCTIVKRMHWLHTWDFADLAYSLT